MATVRNQPLEWLTQRDAWLFALGANDKHGKSLSIADKRKKVGMALADTELVKWSDHEISRQCGVSHSFVGKIRLETFPVDDGKRLVNRGGKTVEVDTSKNKGRPKGEGKPKGKPAAPVTAPAAEPADPVSAAVDALGDVLKDVIPDPAKGDPRNDVSLLDELERANNELIRMTDAVGELG